MPPLHLQRYRLLGGFVGGLLRTLAVYTLLYILHLPAVLSGRLEALAVIAKNSSLKALEAKAAIMLGELVTSWSAVLLAASLVAWFVGGSLVARAWRALTSTWRRRTRLILLAVNVVSTILWVLALISLAMPMLASIAKKLPYLETLADLARRLDAALLAFTLASLTPFIASILHSRESRSRVGRYASMLLAAGSLAYAASTVSLYIAWRLWCGGAAPLRFENGTLEVNQAGVARMFVAFARIASLLDPVLHAVLVGSVLIALGFMGAWLDYRRASRGT